MSGTVLPLRRRQLRDRLARALAQRLGVLAEALEHRDDDAVLLLEQGGEQVRGRDLGVGVLGGEPLRGRHGLLGLDREAVLLHAGMIPG